MALAGLSALCPNSSPSGTSSAPSQFTHLLVGTQEHLPWLAGPTPERPQADHGPFGFSAALPPTRPWFCSPSPGADDSLTTPTAGGAVTDSPTTTMAEMTSFLMWSSCHFLSLTGNPYRQRTHSCPFLYSARGLAAPGGASVAALREALAVELLGLVHKGAWMKGRQNVTPAPGHHPGPLGAIFSSSGGRRYNGQGN